MIDIHFTNNIVVGGRFSVWNWTDANPSLNDITLDRNSYYNQTTTLAPWNESLNIDFATWQDTFGIGALDAVIAAGAYITGNETIGLLTGDLVPPRAPVNLVVQWLFAIGRYALASERLQADGRRRANGIDGRVFQLIAPLAEPTAA